MTAPMTEQRTAFFAEVINGIQRPPNEFPDAMPRRKRVLAVLPIAPPPPPRVPTALELAALAQADQKLMEYLKWKLGPILNELKKRYKKFTRSVWDEWRIDDLKVRQRQDAASEAVVGFGGDNPYYNVDLDTMHMDLYKGLYTTPEAFLEDVSFIENNAEVEGIADDIIRAGQLMNHVKVMLDQTFDEAFKADCAKMAERAAERERNKPTSGKKGKDKEIARATAALNAPYRTRQTASADPTRGPEDHAEASTLKRARAEGEPEDPEADEGPTKRARGEDDLEFGGNVNIISATPSNGHIVANEYQYPPSNGVTNGHTSGSSLSRLLDPSPPGTSAGPSIGGFSTSADVSGIFSDEITPLQPIFSTTGPPIPPQPIFVPVPILTTALSFIPPPAPASNASSALSSPKSPVGLELATGSDHVGTGSGSVTGDEDTAMSSVVAADTAELPPVVEEPEAIIEDPPTPEPFPDFVLSLATLDTLKNLLGHGTQALNVDQLEQLRAACYDAIWRGRKAWDRDELVAELTLLAREFVEEVEECHSAM